MNEIIYKKLLKLSKRAVRKREVPVSAIIEKNGKIISSSYNKRESKNNVLGHAEILCIQKACKKMKTWRLDGCKMYCTLKPCSMCEKIIKESRIEEVVYILEKDSHKKEFNKTKIVKYDDENIEKNFKFLMQNFFKKIR